MSVFHAAAVPESRRISEKPGLDHSERDESVLFSRRLARNSALPGSFQYHPDVFRTCSCPWEFMWRHQRKFLHWLPLEPKIFIEYANEWIRFIRGRRQCRKAKRRQGDA